MKLELWRQSGMLTFTRTFGQVGFRKNGNCLDIWIRVNGRPRWYAVYVPEIAQFLASDAKEVVLYAESDGNTEETLTEALQRESGMEPAR